MCGIIGYIGARDLSGILIDGLRRLEYRGYDSCGVAILDEGKPRVIRAAGRVDNLEEKLRFEEFVPNGVRCGIGHTRWATHGRPTENNAHPHQDCSGQFLVVHNGIIENHVALRARLASQGHSFRTETDTEVLPHLIESYFEGDLSQAVCRALREVEGVFAMVAVSSRDGHKLVAARKGPPLVIGCGAGENFVASDASALLTHTRDVIFLDDAEIAVVRSDGVEIRNLAGARVRRTPEPVTWNVEMTEKGGFAHFMLKEIFEQPRAVRDTLRGRIDEHGLPSLESELGAARLSGADRLHLVACGTSLHAALVGKFMIEGLAGVPVEVDYASEFRYRRPLLTGNCAVVGISQSGETADTLAALAEGRRRGAALLSICNAVGSTIARESDAVLYTRAGPEIGVASTKAFTTQLTALYLLALHLARQRAVLPEDELKRRTGFLRSLPEQMERVLDQRMHVESLAKHFSSHRSFLYLGRGVCHPVALEGALKLKEISYIHAEGYAAGEMKHGPIALVDSEMPAVVLAPRDEVYAKTASNIEELKGRGAQVLAVATDGDTEIAGRVDRTAFIPAADPMLTPLLATLPLQLFAYYVAVERGCDVDKPRNLAKSVTVE